VPKQARLRQLDRLDGYLADLASKFPEPLANRGYISEKIAVHRSLVRAGASDRTKARCAQALINAAAELTRIKPSRAANSRVAAVISMPDMFSSEVCVFFDEAYFDVFTSRSNFAGENPVQSVWTPVPPHLSLARRLSLTVPVGFSELGFQTHDEDRTFSPPWIEDGEVWMIGEVQNRT
jgi:Protein of unknown function (DUF3916)